MPEDKRTPAEQPSQQPSRPTVETTGRRRGASRVARPPARRALASLGVAAVLAVTTFGARRASEIGAASPRSSHEVSKASSGSDSLTVNYGEAGRSTPASRYAKVDPDDVKKDERFRAAAETTLPVTAAVYNSCRNELVVLTGSLESRTRLEPGGRDGKEFILHAWSDSRNIRGEAPGELASNANKHWRGRHIPVVRYRNRERSIDKFHTGPFALPFEREFETRMHLEREGKDPLRYVYGRGDDLFVYVKQRVVIDSRGNQKLENEFRTECH